MTAFSALDREKLLAASQEQTYDLLVIGGGITGAGIALDATTRGLKTILFEKEDFAWGTSSRSTKLIHGGLRYLKQFEIGLVREVGSERAIVHRNARHVVLAEKMLLPIVEGGSLNGFLSSIGLWIYDFLAGVEKEERRKMLPKDKTADTEPLLRKDILKGGGLYYEYRTDDARLTIENLKTAVELGATCLNHSMVTDYIYDNEKVVGVKVKDNFTDEVYTIKAKKVVNATGPWVDNLRAIDLEKVQGKRLQLTKGVHIVVPKEKLPIQQGVYFDVEKDGRMIFAIPRGNITYIGTTDTIYSDKIERPTTTLQDVEYILAATNYMFPSVNLEVTDVISSWAGLRPLIHEDGKSPSELSRKDEIFYSKTGLISIAGGKLTGYRKMAERIVDMVSHQLRKEEPDAYKILKGCQTADLKLAGGQFDSQKDLTFFIERRIGEAKQIGAKPHEIVDLVYKYGSKTDDIIEIAYELYNKVPNPAERILVAELIYCIRHEMTATLNDFLIRRTGRLYFERPSLEKLYPFFAEEMGKILGWSEADKFREMGKFKKEYDEVISFMSSTLMADI